MKKVAIDARMINHSGIGTYIRNVMPGIIQSNPQIQFCIWGNAQELTKSAIARFDNVKVMNLEIPIYGLREQWHWWRTQTRTMDLFWSPHYNIPLYCACPLMVTVHDIYHLREKTLAWHKKEYARYMMEQIKSTARQVIVPSLFTKAELQEWWKGGSLPPVEVIHNGVAEIWFEMKKATTYQKTPYLLYVGNVKPHKNLGRLIAAFRSLLDELPHNLVIAGKKDGFITPDLEVEAAMRDAALQDRVIWTGRVSDEELQLYVQQADMMIFPSLYEGFGLPPLEAMAAGCPVAVSDISVLREVCGDGASYFDPLYVADIAQSIRRIYGEDAEQRRRRIINGKQRARKFSWSEVVQKTSDLIREAVQL